MLFVLLPFDTRSRGQVVGAHALDILRHGAYIGDVGLITACDACCVLILFPMCPCAQYSPENKIQNPPKVNAFGIIFNLVAKSTIPKNNVIEFD